MRSFLGRTLSAIGSISLLGAAGPITVVPNGATLPFVATGGTTAASNAARAGRHLNVVDDFGADPTGVADSTTLIQLALTSLCSSGGGDLLFPGTFKITATLTVTCSNVRLLGYGRGELHGDLTWDAKSRLVWAGVTNGTLLSIAPVANTTSGKRIIASGIEGILLDCNGIAATCGYFGSVQYGRFVVSYNNPVTGTSATGGIIFDTIDLAEANDNQSNDIDISGAELGSGGRGVIFEGKSRNATAVVSNTLATTNGSTTLSFLTTQSPAPPASWIGKTITGAGIPGGATVTATSATTVTISAAATATSSGVATSILGVGYFGNSSYNVIHRLDVRYWRGTPLTLRETDNNIFEIWGLSGPPTIPPGYANPNYATANSIELEGCSNGDSICFNPSNNVFIQGGAAGGIMARGTETFLQASGQNGGIYSPNVFLRLDKGNGVADPTVGTGAAVIWGDNNGFDQGKGFYNTWLGASRAQVNTLRTTAGTAGGTAMIASAGLPTVRLYASDVSSYWSSLAGTDASLTWTNSASAIGAFNIGTAGQSQASILPTTNGNIVNYSVQSSGAANVPVALSQKGASPIYFVSNGQIAFQVNNPSGSIANNLVYQPGTTGNFPTLTFQGSDSAVGAVINMQGTGGLYFRNAAGTNTQAVIDTNGLTLKGHFITTGQTAPTASAGAIVTGSADLRGGVTLAASTVASTITFNVAFASAPFCVVSGSATTATAAATTTTSTLAIALSANAAGNTVTWHCIQ